MEDVMTSTESDVGTLLGIRAEAFRAKDIDRLMPIYSPDIVYFDLVPPLRYTGFVAVRERFLDWFSRWKSSIGQELSDMNIATGRDVAAAHMLIQTSGTLKDGREVGYWVRTSNSFQRSNGRWLITHEHVSLPVDIASGSAAMNLVP
jgi:ketosteroid isomerase-like protein